ncbi:MAG: aminoacyl-tRNA hydrolase [Gammaproteobacteria bacterium]|nr:aminoacyl-tRNA hydrolase [Gammaproteobacteria bacterium]
MTDKVSVVPRLIVGLGNPGAQYEGTRHNAGFLFVDHLADRFSGMFRTESRFFGEVCRIRMAGEELWLLKPSTFMNRSGQAVSSLARYYKITPQQILVAHDELDLPPGTARLKQGGGHAGHNGLRDIISALKEKNFWRLRIGIDHPGDRSQVVNFVLGRPSRSDADAIDLAVDEAAASLPLLMEDKSEQFMHRLHSKH